MVAMVPVKSSRMRAIGYDPDSRELHVRFREDTYIYPNVSAGQHAALMSAESHGKHFHKHIRGNPNHPHRKVVR